MLYFVLLAVESNAESVDIGLFWSKGEERHGGKLEAGLTYTIDKINMNSTMLANRTLRLMDHRSNCSKKKILAGSIDYVSPSTVDLMIGDTCLVTTELGGLVASQYNIPFFDFGSKPLYLQDRSYGTLIRTRDNPSNIRYVYSTLAEYQNFRWTCLFVPQQIRANVKRVRQDFAMYDRHINVTVMWNFYYDLVKGDYSALSDIKTSCRGNSFHFGTLFQ